MKVLCRMQKVQNVPGLLASIVAVPPGARAKAQMTATECKETEEVANVRIHVERTINGVKTFRILKNTFQLQCCHLQMI